MATLVARLDSLTQKLDDLRADTVDADLAAAEKMETALEILQGLSINEDGDTDVDANGEGEES